MPLYRHNGVLIAKNNALAVGQPCCCAPRPAECCGNTASFASSDVVVTTQHILDVEAGSSCGCGPGGVPPAEATRCIDNTIVFGRTIATESCRIQLRGDLYGKEVSGEVQLGQTLDLQCFLYVSTSYRITPCAEGVFLAYAFPYEPFQSKYSATFYIFRYSDTRGLNPRSIITTVDVVPEAPTGFTYRRHRHIIKIDVEFS